MHKILDTYNYLHTIPELGFEEFKTSAYLADALEEIGYEVTRNVGNTTGVVGIIKGEEAGPTVLLRADMDALPFTVDGKLIKVHACGHDTHCAMLLEAAETLKNKVKKGTLKILFQPGEETAKGATAMVNAGVFEGVDYALGLHVRPIQEIHSGGMTPALRHGATAWVKFDIKGINSHGARPHLGVNAIETAVLIANAIMAIKEDPSKQWSCKVTGINSNNPFNVITDTATINVDCRAQSNRIINSLIEKLKNIGKGIGLAQGATVDIYTPVAVVPAAEFDEDLVAMVGECIKEVLGEENYVPEIITPGGEDFHFIAVQCPTVKCCYMGVGTGCTPGMHNIEMHMDLDKLQNGTDVLVKATLKLIG
ncbi:MAG: amidohydrolase [Phascolarctobacterium sp.]|nr:amidohydrolase [Phascolarctobacterium sp.]